MKYRIFWRDTWCLMLIWREFHSPVTDRYLWKRLYLGPVELRVYPK